ncbi:MAG: hypothetical protein RR806_03515 [Oscillospiraceae bacterium]
MGYNPIRLVTTIEKFGVMKTIQNQISRKNTSENFNLLEQKKRLDLSIEATVTQGKYSELFTDEEVDFCFNILCEVGYYKF